MNKRNNKKLYYLVLIAIVVVIPLISIGYSALATTLNIRGDIFSVYVNPRTETFPNEIEYIMDNEECMEKYEGEVTDEVGQTVTTNNVYFNKCADKRNIIFNNMCWQMIRTTETGGIKMIYNGEPVNGKCESTRGNHKGIVGATGSTENLNASYLYGSSFTYDTVNNNFTLVNTTTATWSASTYQNLLGKFTCKNTTGTCTTLYNVNGYNDATTAHTSAYTIGNTNYAQIGTSAFNAYGKSAAMVGYMFNKVYDLKSINPGTNTYKYGNSFTYSNGTYTLSGTTQDISDWSTGYNKLKNTHYTCWNTSGTCNTISYIFITSSTYANYIEISGGKSVSDALNEMLYNNDVNTYNSSIKGIIDNWYVNNLSTRTNMLEDTVYCNARNTISLGAWNPNGGSTISSYMIKFKNYNVNNDISCPNETDQFAVSNNKAKLTYPVALATQEELYTLTNNSNSTYYDVLTKTGDSWRNFSPYHYGGGTQMRRVSESGGVNAGNSGTIDAGVRPAISLKNGVSFSGGTGSEADPWIVDEREKLHDKIVDLSNTDSLITKYNGDVTDSVGSTTTATKVYFDRDLDKRNLIFGGYCWQVIRTTETGGTKVIYNGEPVDGKCESTRGNHKGVIGTYAASSTLNSSYLYGTSFTYNTTTNEFTLVDTITATWSDSTYQSLLGKFTCINTTGTCTTLYSVNGYLSATSAYTPSYVIGDTTYAQIGTSAYNGNYRSLAMEGYMFNKVYNYQSGAPASGSLMGNDVSYSNGTYTLLPAAGESTLGTTKDNTHHYTCNTTSSTCNKVRYYYYGNYYIELDGAANIETAVNEMLYDNNVNTYNSSIKAIIDSWYAQKLSTKTNMLEDVVYCNARNMTNGTTNGWNKDGNLSAYAYFKSYNLSNDISCVNLTDQFAVGNNKAKLTYPVGLATHEELYTLTNNNNSSYYSLTKTNDIWWGLSPSYFGEYQASARYVLGSGFVNTYSNVYQDIGVRLVISLKNDVMINSGSGSETNPWIIQE